MTDINTMEVRDLLRRIDAFLAEAKLEEAMRYRVENPAVLLSEASDTIEDMALRLGLWQGPRTVSRPDPAAKPKEGALTRYYRSQRAGGGAALGATLAGITAAFDRADKGGT